MRRTARSRVSTSSPATMASPLYDLVVVQHQTQSGQRQRQPRRHRQQPELELRRRRRRGSRTRRARASPPADQEFLLPVDARRTARRCSAPATNSCTHKAGTTIPTTRTTRRRGSIGTRWSRNRDMFRFFQKMIAFRKAHPSIGRGRFWRDDVRWYGVGRDVDLTSDVPHARVLPARRVRTGPGHLRDDQCVLGDIDLHDLRGRAVRVVARGRYSAATALTTSSMRGSNPLSGPPPLISDHARLSSCCEASAVRVLSVRPGSSRLAGCKELGRPWGVLAGTERLSRPASRTRTTSLRAPWRWRRAVEATRASRRSGRTRESCRPYR